uniref:Sodium channel, voltage-gated, type I, beta b n=1 Tax=Astyanax mexicanus TaxID=7994 RepID=A0A8B9K9G6_ASTMX
CALVDSDTEAVAGQDFKLGCISCKMRGEVEASATADWFFKARGETEFAHVSNLCVYTVYIHSVFRSLIKIVRYSPDLVVEGSLSHIRNICFHAEILCIMLFNKDRHMVWHINKCINELYIDSTRGTASIVSEIMMYVSIIGLQLWLLVEMIYCYRKIAAAGDEALRASASVFRSPSLIIQDHPLHQPVMPLT